MGFLSEISTLETLLYWLPPARVARACLTSYVDIIASMFYHSHQLLVKPGIDDEAGHHKILNLKLDSSFQKIMLPVRSGHIIAGENCVRFSID